MSVNMKTVWECVKESYMKSDFFKAKWGAYFEEEMDMQADIINHMAALYIYQGFDPNATLERFCELNTKWENETGDIEIGVGEARKVYKKNASTTHDARILLSIFAARGVDHAKLSNKSLANYKGLVEHMFDKYELKRTRNDPGSALPPDQITMPRLAACFPAQFVHLFHTVKAKVIFNLSDLGPGATEFPVLGSSFLISCIPLSLMNRKRSMHILFFAIHFLSDKVQHRKKGDYTALVPMHSYYLAAFRSTALSQKGRWAALLCGIFVLHRGFFPTHS